MRRATAHYHVASRSFPENARPLGTPFVRNPTITPRIVNLQAASLSQLCGAQEQLSIYSGAHMTLSRRRPVDATEIAQDEEEQGQEEHEAHDAPSTRLKFNESLTWRAGRAIPVGELLRRLQALSRELRGMEQDDEARETLLPVAKELAAQNLVNHKDGGVRAWTACCIVDMFRLCAPDAPYTASQLRVSASRSYCCQPVSDP